MQRQQYLFATATYASSPPFETNWSFEPAHLTTQEHGTEASLIVMMNRLGEDGWIYVRDYPPGGNTRSHLFRRPAD